MKWPQQKVIPSHSQFSMKPGKLDKVWRVVKGSCRLVLQYYSCELNMIDENELISPILQILREEGHSMSSDELSNELTRIFGCDVTGGATRRALFKAKQDGYVYWAQGHWNLKQTSVQSPASKQQSRSELLEHITKILTENS